MKKLGTLQHLGFDCVALLAEYPHGKRPAIILKDPTTGEQLMVATINVPDEPLEPDEVVIKSYSEGAGLEVSLAEAGVIHPPHRLLPVEYALAHVARLKT